VSLKENIVISMKKFGISIVLSALWLCASGSLPAQTYTTLANFSDKDGSPIGGGMVQGTDGNFYGTTGSTIFKVTPSGVITALHTFEGTDGAIPDTGVIQGSDGNFYGTTQWGGTDNSCKSGGKHGNSGCGTIFKITPSGTFTSLHSFQITDGQAPRSLVQGTDGNFYGITLEGGSGSVCGTSGCGTLFKMTPSGTLTVLYSFLNQPFSGLIQGTNGVFYGTSSEEAVGDYDGSIYSLSVGLGPFVETQPGSGAVGAAVNILGADLTGATKVTFNGTTAKFTVASSSLITTTVPAGATTGAVKE
jgi:uncharacterized repeat protein (TIGR03803 family)